MELRLKGRCLRRGQLARGARRQVWLLLLPCEQPRAGAVVLCGSNKKRGSAVVRAAHTF